MDIRLDRQAGVLTLELTAGDELEALARELVQHQAFMVPLAEELPIETRLSVTLRCAGRYEQVMEAEVMHRFDTLTADYGTAFRLLDWSAQRAAQLEALLGGGEGAGDERREGDRAAEHRAVAGGGATGDDGRATVDDGDAGSEEAADEPDASETLGVSTIHTIRQMNVSERARLAMRASRQERQILLRDTSAQVLLGLVSNPRLEAPEVLRVVRTTHVTGTTLERVARDPRWGKNREILAAIAVNPKTPSPLAVRLMAALRTADLRRMAKISSGLRENVRRAALREYLKRTSNT